MLSWNLPENANCHISKYAATSTLPWTWAFEHGCSQDCALVLSYFAEVTPPGFSREACYCAHSTVAHHPTALFSASPPPFPKGHPPVVSPHPLVLGISCSFWGPTANTTAPAPATTPSEARSVRSAHGASAWCWQEPAQKWGHNYQLAETKNYI